jgi:hypothetical protein
VSDSSAVEQAFVHGKLKLEHCGLTDTQFAALCETIKRVPILHELDVIGNGLKFESAISLLQLLQWQIRDAYDFNSTYCPDCLERARYANSTFPVVVCRCEVSIIRPVHYLWKCSLLEEIEEEIRLSQAQDKLVSNSIPYMQKLFYQKPRTIDEYKEMYDKFVFDTLDEINASGQESKSLFFAAKIKERFTTRFLAFAEEQYEEKYIEEYQVRVRDETSKIECEVELEFYQSIQKWYYKRAPMVKEMLTTRVEKKRSKYRRELAARNSVWTTESEYDAILDGRLSAFTVKVLEHYIQIGKEAQVTSIHLGQSHTVALSESGVVWTCGYEEDGQLGHGSLLDQLKYIFANAAKTGHLSPKKRPTSPSNRSLTPVPSRSSTPLPLPHTPSRSDSSRTPSRANTPV